MAGRAPAGSQVHRLVPLSDANYVCQLETMVATQNEAAWRLQIDVWQNSDILNSVSRR